VGDGLFALTNRTLESIVSLPRFLLYIEKVRCKKRDCVGVYHKILCTQWKKLHK